MPGIIMFIFSWAFALESLSQAVTRFNTFSYGVNEGLLQTTIGDIEIDRNNFCWISFPNGIQKFDGSRFVNVPVQPGLPEDKYTQLFRTASGDLLIGHNYGISRYDANKDQFSLVHHLKIPDKWPLILVGEDNGVIYCSNHNGVITALSSIDYKLLFRYKTGIDLPFMDVSVRPAFSENIIDNRVALRLDSTVFLIDLREKKILRSIPVPGFRYSSMLRMKSGSEISFFGPKRYDQLQTLDFNTGLISSRNIKGIRFENFHRNGFFTWGNKLLFYHNNRLFEIDSATLDIESELVNFQNKPVAGITSISRLVTDDLGNIYLQTVNAGIRKILGQNYPIKYFGNADPEKNNILSILPDKKNNRVLTGGTGGLFIYDTLQQLVKHLSLAPNGARLVPNGIIKTKKGYLIISNGLNRAYHLSNDLSSINPVSYNNPIPGEHPVDFFGLLLYNDGERAVFQSQNKLFRINIDNLEIYVHKFSSAYIMSGTWYKNMIISHGTNELIFLDGNTFREIKKIPFTEGGGVRCFLNDKKRGLFVGTNKGVFRIDANGQVLKKWDRKSGLPDECIYAMRFDAQGNLWCSTNRGIIRISPENSTLNILKEDGLQENEFNTGVVAETEDGELFFGGINGVSSFYPHQVRSLDDRINLLLTGIHVNNKVIHNNDANSLGKLELPYGQNSLSFDFVAMGKSNPDQYIYQYRMKGFDDEWLHNKNLQSVRYSLAPGKYVLQLYASRQFNKDAEPMKELVVVIKPPFWKQWWFYMLLAAIAITLLAFGINFYNRNKYAKKLHALESEHKLKLERERLSRDLHDNLGAYSNAILFNTQSLEHEKDDVKRRSLIKELKFASKDIITTLRETIWALNKENYSAEDCLLRIRNFIQTMNRFYPDIHMVVSGTAPGNKNFHSKDAFNLVRIVQEAITNSIKHSNCSNIILHSGGSDKEWMLTVKDDGKGFNVEDESAGEHGNGLGNMQQRARESGFQLQINSGPGTGAQVTLTI